LQPYVRDGPMTVMYWKWPSDTKVLEVAQIQPDVRDGPVAAR